MSVRDLILIGVAFGGIIAGVFLPQAAEPLDGYPRISLMLMLFLSFLGLRTQEVLGDVVRLRSRLLVMSIGKLFFTPLVTFSLFVMLMPKFALGALLLAGTPVGVISAFFALVMRADFTLALTGVVFTSLVSPFTLPLLTSLALVFLGTNAEGMAHFSPLRMSLDMATLILIPYALAQAAQAVFPRSCLKLMAVRFWINTATLGVCNLAVFAKYSPTLRQSPELLLPGLAAALLAGLVFFICGAILSWRWPLPQQVSMGIGIGVSNGVMAMILGMEFFGLTEALPGAFFAIPTVLVLLPTRLLIRLRTGNSYELPLPEEGNRHSI